MAYSIAAALDSRCFDAVIVSTDSEEYAAIARHYGAEVPFLRPPEMSGDLSPDIQWVEHALRALAARGREFPTFSILRPTSPFRKPETIQRAVAAFSEAPHADSLRAVERCTQHPGKMWVLRGRQMTPLLPFTNGDVPWHSTPYQGLPEVYIQNASLEIAWSRVALQGGTIAGDIVIPFVTRGDEGFDVNNPDDWLLAERRVAEDPAALPVVRQQPWQTTDRS